MVKTRLVFFFFRFLLPKMTTPCPWCVDCGEQRTGGSSLRPRPEAKHCHLPESAWSLRTYPNPSRIFLSAIYCPHKILILLFLPVRIAVVVTVDIELRIDLTDPSKGPLRLVAVDAARHRDSLTFPAR